MKHLGIEINIKNKPELDPEFIPMHKWGEAFLQTAKEPFGFALERNDKQMYVMDTFIHGDKNHREADVYYISRMIKFNLWQKGGFRLYIKGNDSVYQALKLAYSPKGSRSFDAEFFGSLYQKEFDVVKCDELPAPFEIKKRIGGHFDGCRVGVDFGGSDYKAASVIDGEAVYSNETVWNPKINADPDYHFNGFVSAIRESAKNMPRVDAIGVSCAGLIENNRVLAAQLYQKVPKDLFDSKVREIWFRVIKEFGDNIPFEVVNDGDVAALAGSISLGRKNLLGLALGTSFIGGFVDTEGYLSNWKSELAFAPVDASPDAPMDDWTCDIGVGVHYFCQEAVIKLAPAAGISLDGIDTPAKKLKKVQNLLNKDHEGASAIFRSIGVYLGHTIPYYYESYKADSVLLLGRVVSGKGGDIILKTANTVLSEEYPGLSVELLLPDEKTRRLGQSVAAASLPEIVK